MIAGRKTFSNTGSPRTNMSVQSLVCMISPRCAESLRRSTVYRKNIGCQLIMIYSPGDIRSEAWMAIVEQIDKDLVAAMKAKEGLRLSVLRMMKTALKLKQTEAGKAVDDAQALAVFRTLVKQRHDSAEQFRKGGREEMAAKEEAEIKIVESYLP